MGYCTRAEIETYFGRENVLKWSELDGDKLEASVTARIADAIASATDDVDNALRGGAYPLPFTTVPRTIMDITRRLAAVRLYESRGVQDFSEETGFPVHRLQWHKTDCMRMLAALRSGRIRLDSSLATANQTYPQVVKEPCPPEYPLEYDPCCG